MRSFNQAAAAWSDLKAVFGRHRSLDGLRSSIRLNHDATPIIQDGLRSACWKAFLVVDTIDTTQWLKILTSSRSAYNAVREHYNAEAELSPSITSPNNVQSTELRTEIHQDVERCMPENLYFRQPETQAMMIDILYVFCRLNPDLGYRQGMHELLAPILWTVERDAIDLGPASKAFGEDAVIRAVFDADHIEHDTFTLFCQVMQGAKSFYEQTTHSSIENPIVLRSRHIFEVLMPQVDPELAQHLKAIDVVPQIFLMRWIRLLFGREFTFDQTLLLWDTIFVIDPSLEIVNHICLVMLLRMRWQLVDADYQAALMLLLQSTQPESSFNASAFVMDALYLQEHPDLDGSSYLVLKYTNRAMRPPGRPNTPPALQRNITTFSGALNAAIRSTPSPSRRGRQSRNLEAMIQSTAKNIYARGERLGTIGKAVRSAVDEVHRKALEIREARETSDLSSSSANAYSQNRLKVLEERQAQLGKLLNDAVSELWEYQKLVTDKESEINNMAHVEKLSVAIAKAQFVQVYLQDPSLPLPTSEETDPTSDLISEKVVTPQTVPRIVEQSTNQSIAIHETTSEPKVMLPERPSTLLEDIPTASHDTLGQVSRQATPSRPLLAESSFSWMLEQQSDDISSPQAPKTRRPIDANSALFTESQSLSDAVSLTPMTSPNSRAGRPKSKRQSITRTATTSVEDPFGPTS